MTQEDAPVDYEVDPAVEKFIDFVVGHSTEDTSGLIGGIRSGEYTVTPQGQLIPFDRVQVTKFHLDPEDPDLDPNDVGYTVSLHHGEVVRFGVAYFRGKFYEIDEVTGFNPVVDAGEGPNLVTELKLLEQTGDLRLI